MKKSVKVVMILLMVLVAVSPVWAMGRGPGKWRPEPVDRVREPLPGRQYFTLVGIVQSVGNAKIEVLIHGGNRFVKPYLEDVLEVQLDASTLYRAWTPDGCDEAELGDVDQGDSVSIHGTVSEDVFTAERVTVDVPLDCCTR